MDDAKLLSQIGTNAVRQLRLDKLRQGQPFMINSKELPFNQCYLEYPNGSIVLTTLSKSARDFDVIRELSSLEASVIRNRFGLKELNL